jgi:hypothetical protein
MKTKKHFLGLVITSVFLLFACSSPASVEKENRKVSGFNAIKISSGIDLYVTMGDEEKVTIVADGDIIDEIITEVKDGVLKIHQKEHLFNWMWNKERKAYVTVKTLKKIEASAGSDVKSENTITGDNLELDISSGSDLKMNVEVEKLSLESSSGSDANLSGKAKYFKADASSGSDINASELKTKICEVEVSSGSDASVNVSDQLVARASSGGDITYSGDPQDKDIHKSSGGGVQHK